VSQINKPPIGLQSFLDSKNFGKNPSQLSDVVAGTVDLFPFLGVYDLFSEVSGPHTIAADGNFATVTVPTGQVWLLESVGIHCKVLTAGAAGDGGRFSCAFDQTINSNSQVNHPLALLINFFPARAAATTQPVYDARHFPNYIPFRGDELLRFQCSDVVATGAFDMEAYAMVRYYKLEV